jgi:hypothetical protein
LSTPVHQLAQIIHPNQPSWFQNLYQIDDQHHAAKFRPLQNWKFGPTEKSWPLWKEKKNLISSNWNKMYKSRYILHSLRFFLKWLISIKIFCDMMQCSLLDWHQISDWRQRKHVPPKCWYPSI